MSSDPDPDPDATDADATADTPAPSGRDAVLGMLEEAISECHRKAVSGRVYDEKAEEVRQGWFRTMAYTAETYRQLLKDDDLDEMSEAIQKLRQTQQSPGTAAIEEYGD